MSLPAGSRVEKFIDNDTGYREWLLLHPNGFVINAPRTGNSAYLVLHRALCRTIQPRVGKHWTKEYIKVCANHLHDLEVWATDEAGGAAHLCPTCFQ
jgi:hypothetical protein